MTKDALIYGKGTLDRILNIEINDDIAFIYRLSEDEEVEVLTRPNKFWVLSHNQLTNNAIRLEGDLHFKYAYTFKRRSDFYSFRSRYKKQDTYSIFEPKEAYMVKEGEGLFYGLKKEDLSVMAVDIETTGLDPHASDARVLMISTTFKNRNGTKTRKLFSFDDFDNDREMFDVFSKHVRTYDPDVLVAHNGHSFDWNYLSIQASKLGTSLDIGRDDSSLSLDIYKSKFRKDQLQFIEYYRPRVHGRDIIDTMFLAIKYDNIMKKYESYALKKIIEAEGLTVKDRVMVDANRIRYDYKDPIKLKSIKAYAEFDADDALALYDLYISNYFYSAQSVPKSLQAICESATGSQINSLLVRSYLQEKHSIPKADQIEHFDGAISFGNTGIFNNINKIDAASLYPSCIRAYNIYEKSKDPEKKFLKMVDYFTEHRLKNKRLAKETGERIYTDLEQSAKVFINSAFGFAGAPGLNFNSLFVASEITKRGREVLNKVMEWSGKRGLIIANGDTDSISYGKSDGSFITKEEREEHLKEVNNLFPPQIRFEPDGFFKKFIVLKAKNYIMTDENGKTKKKGSSLKDSKTALALKEMTDKMIQAIVDDKAGTLNEIYLEYVKEAMNVKDIKRWSSKKSISQKVLTSERSNESKVRDAIEDTEIVEGDKVYMYYKPDDTLCLSDNFDGSYHKERLLENLYKKVQLFSEVIDTSQLLNYKLVKNKPALCELIGVEYVKPSRKKKEKHEDSVHI